MLMMKIKNKTVNETITSILLFSQNTNTIQFVMQMLIRQLLHQYACDTGFLGLGVCY